MKTKDRSAFRLCLELNIQLKRNRFFKAQIKKIETLVEEIEKEET
jgi:hypothetical protein